jgi:hypothetical protein
MRELGLCATSAGSIQQVKRHVDRLGLDTSHFTGQRRWSDAQLRRVVADAVCWDELIAALGLARDHGDSRIVVKAHATRLGLDLSRLQSPHSGHAAPPGFKPDMRRLRDAGTSIAAAWFLLCGYNASFPVEPTVYDLLVSMPDGIKRVQVKTTTFNKDGWNGPCRKATVFCWKPRAPGPVRPGRAGLLLYPGRRSQHVPDSQSRTRRTSYGAPAQLP